MARFTSLVSLLAAAATTVSAQSPSQLPSVSGFQTSGSTGCSAVHSGGDYTAERWDIKNFSSSSTANCEIHVNSGGGAAGWQVALSYATISGKTTLSSGAELDLYVDYFWSQNAANTVSIPLSNTNLRTSMTGTSLLTIYQAVAEGEIKSSGTFSVALNVPSSKLLWSQCIGSDGNPGILNVDVRGAIGGSGTGNFEIDEETWYFAWRKC
jgi:hypothetical protein